MPSVTTFRSEVNLTDISSLVDVADPLSSIRESLFVCFTLLEFKTQFIFVIRGMFRMFRPFETPQRGI